MRVLLDANAVLLWSLDRASLRTEVDELLMAGHRAGAVRGHALGDRRQVADRPTPAPRSPRVWLARMVRELALEILPITQTHVVQVADLPDHHGDPFDRLLIAQAQVEGIPIVTADRSFARYDAEVIAAR